MSQIPNLRSSLIKLAHQNPDLRPVLLPVLTASVDKESDFKSTLDSLFKSYHKKHPDTKSPPPSLVDQAHKTEDEKEHALKSEHPSLQKAEDSGKKKDEAAFRERAVETKKNVDAQKAEHHRLTTQDPKTFTDADLAKSDEKHKNTSRQDQQIAHHYSGQGGEGSADHYRQTAPDYKPGHHEKVKAEIEHRKTPEQKKKDKDEADEKHRSTQQKMHQDQAGHHKGQAEHHDKQLEHHKSKLDAIAKDPSKAKEEHWGGEQGEHPYRYTHDAKKESEDAVKHHTQQKEHHEQKHKEHADKAQGLNKTGSLRSAMIRLAHENPNLRPHLLPILTASTNRTAMTFPTKEALEAYRKEHDVGSGTELKVDPVAHHMEQRKKHMGKVFEGSRQKARHLDAANAHGLAAKAHEGKDKSAAEDATKKATEATHSALSSEHLDKSQALFSMPATKKKHAEAAEAHWVASGMSKSKRPTAEDSVKAHKLTEAIK